MIKVTGKLTVKKDNSHSLMEILRHTKDAHVTIGVHEDAGSYGTGKDAPSVVEVALWNEFGTRDIPERSFMRSTFDENVAKINQWREEAVKHMVMDGWSVEKALEMIGLRIQTLVQNKIKSNVPPPNAPSTAAAKTKEGVAARTLIESGLLLRSVTYKVYSK